MKMARWLPVYQSDTQGDWYSLDVFPKIPMLEDLIVLKGNRTFKRDGLV